MHIRVNVLIGVYQGTKYFVLYCMPTIDFVSSSNCEMATPPPWSAEAIDTAILLAEYDSRKFIRTFGCARFETYIG